MRSETTAQGTILRPWQQRLGRIDWHNKAIVALIVISYAVYLPKHLSIDSWNVQKVYAALDQMQSGHFEAVWGEALFSYFAGGRFSRGILFLAFALARKASWLVTPWVNWVAITFMCLAGCKMWKLLQKTIDGSSIRSDIVYICCLISICQPFFTDWMQYIECQLHYPLALWLAVSSAAVLYGGEEKKLTVKRWCISSALLIVSAGFYQIALQYFVLLAVSSTLLSLYDAKSVPEMIQSFVKRILAALTVYAAAAAAQLLLVSRFHSSRVHANSLQEIAEKLWRAQKRLWMMTPYTSNRVSALFPVLVILLTIWCVLRIASVDRDWREKSARFILSIVGLAGYYTALFLPLILSELWFSQRAMVGFWGIPLVIAAAGSGIKTSKSVFCAAKGRLLLCASLCVLLFSNVYSCIRFGTDLYRVNATDEMRGRWICQSISKYEQETGTTIRQIAFHQDGAPTYVYPNVVSSYENNQAAWSADWDYLAIVETVSGRTFQQCEYPDELFFDRYGEINWDFLDEDQIFFQNETAYIAVY